MYSALGVPPALGIPPALFVPSQPAVVPQTDAVIAPQESNVLTMVGINHVYARYNRVKSEHCASVVCGDFLKVDAGGVFSSKTPITTLDISVENFSFVPLEGADKTLFIAVCWCDKDGVTLQRQLMQETVTTGKTHATSSANITNTGGYSFFTLSFEDEGNNFTAPLDVTIDKLTVLAN
ncbi:hypothetical protein ATCVCanal1_879L [Acanthocystis turfacea Chlorella virus Canal-1]|nr:hypothetical protein ATCVCanal1_879L [Acanthocystis turfacea Chlorella virus Canal-1]